MQFDYNTMLLSGRIQGLEKRGEAHGKKAGVHSVV